MPELVGCSKTEYSILLVRPMGGNNLPFSEEDIRLMEERAQHWRTIKNDTDTWQRIWNHWWRPIGATDAPISHPTKTDAPISSNAPSGPTNVVPSTSTPGDSSPTPAPSIIPSGTVTPHDPSGTLTPHDPSGTLSPQSVWNTNASRSVCNTNASRSVWNTNASRSVWNTNASRSVWNANASRSFRNNNTS